MEWIVQERPKDVDLINKSDGFLTFQDVLECVKQFQKHLLKEKSKIIKIGYNQEQILRQLKESKEFIDTSFKRLKMSKSAITFKIKLYKLL